MAAELEMRMLELLDKQDIREQILRYSRACDRQDYDLMRSVFHGDALYDHYQFDGSGGGDSIARNVLDAMGTPSLLGQMHFVPQSLIEVKGDVAYAETYGLTCNVLAGEGESKNTYFRGIRLIDRWERRDGKTWKLAYRTIRNDGFERFDAIAHPIELSDDYRGRRSPDIDGSYDIEAISSKALGNA